MTKDTAVLQRLATSLRHAARDGQPILPVREELAAMGVAGAMPSRTSTPSTTSRPDAA